MQWLFENEAYLGRVHWRGQSYPGLHEPLVDEPTFQAAQALLRERGEDLTLRRGNRSDFLLSGRDPLRPLQTRLRRHERQRQRRPLPLLRLLRPAEARPQSLRRRTLEPRQARSRRPQPARRPLPRRRPDRRRAPARLRRAGGRPAGDSRSNSARSPRRSAAASARSTATTRRSRAATSSPASSRPDSPTSRRSSTRSASRNTTLAAQLADPADTLDPAALAAVADRLRDTLATGEPEQTKALLRLLIKELRVNGRSEILPTYRVVTPEVCATPSSVGVAGIEPVGPTSPTTICVLDRSSTVVRDAQSSDPHEQGPDRPTPSESVSPRASYSGTKRHSKQDGVHSPDNKNASEQGLLERMMGLEPTTFCMASGSWVRSSSDAIPLPMRDSVS